MVRRQGEILFEMTRVGSYVRVCAICARTGIEVTMVGDPAKGQEMLKRLAARKLMYVLDKKAKAAKAARDDGRTDIKV